MGDPAGIGGEIALRVWAARRETAPIFCIIDDVARLVAIAERFGIPCPVASINSPDQAAAVFARALPVLRPEHPLTTPVALGQPIRKVWARPVHARTGRQIHWICRPSRPGQASVQRPPGLLLAQAGGLGAEPKTRYRNGRSR